MAEQRIDSYREASFDELNRDISSFINASGEFSQNVKNASSIFNQALDSMNKNLAFVSKELQSTFKQYSSVEGKKQKFMFEFYQQQADLRSYPWKERIITRLCQIVNMKRCHVGSPRNAHSCKVLSSI